MNYLPHGAPVAHPQPRTTITSWRAMLLASLFLAGTCFVLFQDLYEGAPLNTSHVLTLLALIGATAAGHSCLPVWREGRHILSLGLMLVALGGLAYIVTMSGARNAETIAAKVSTVTVSNAQRHGIEGDIEITKRDLKVQDAAANAECASGVGKKCDGKRTTADRTRSHLALLEAQLALAKPATVANAGYKHLAKLWVKAMGGVEAAAEEVLILFMPFIAVLITELGTIVFLGMALSHTPQSALQVPTRTRAEPLAHSFPNPNTVSPDELDAARKVLIGIAPQGPRGGTRAALPVIPDNSNVIEHPVLAALRAGPIASNNALARAMGVTKGEASKRRGEVAHLLHEVDNGRCIMIDLKPEVRAAFG